MEAQEERVLGKSWLRSSSSDTYLSREVKSVMLQLRQNSLVRMGEDSQEDKLRSLDIWLSLLRLMGELMSVPELAMEGEGLCPRGISCLPPVSASTSGFLSLFGDPEGEGEPEGFLVSASYFFIRFLIGLLGKILACVEDACFGVFGFSFI